MIILEIAAAILLVLFVLRYFAVIALAASMLFALCAFLIVTAAIYAFSSMSNEATYLMIGIAAFVAFCIWTHDKRWHVKADASASNAKTVSPDKKNPA